MLSAMEILSVMDNLCDGPSEGGESAPEVTSRSGERTTYGLSSEILCCRDGVSAALESAHSAMLLVVSAGP